MTDREASEWWWTCARKRVLSGKPYGQQPAS